MQKNLVIVESPAKAKTIEKFLGSDYKVMSSYGHIRDLKKKNFGVDLNTFEPQYEIPADKKHVVSDLRAQAKSRRRYGSHPMKIVKEKLSHGTWLRCWDSTPRKLAASCSMK